MAITPLQEWDPSSKAGDPAYHAAVLTKSDTADCPFYSTGLYIGGTGDVAVVMAGDHIPGMTAAQASAVAVKFSAVPVGVFLPLRIGRLMSTGTTATLITAVSR